MGLSTFDKKHRSEEMPSSSCCLSGDGASLESVSTSSCCSVRFLLSIRVVWLIFLLVGGLWLTRETHDKPLCLPDWSYITSAAYFALAVFSCLRHLHLESCSGDDDMSPSQEPTSRSRSCASSLTLFLLETSIVYQTVAVIVTWTEYALDGQQRGRRAMLSSLGLVAILVDLILSRSRVQARHAWVLLAFLLAWSLQQVWWVSSGPDREACYTVFDAKSVGGSVVSAAVAALVIVALLVAYAALCAERDKLMVRFGLSPEPVSAMQDDVVEDLGEDGTMTRSLSLPAMNRSGSFRPPPASERSSVVNPIYAGSGSRMRRNPWGHTSWGKFGAGGADLSGDGDLGTAGVWGLRYERRSSVMSMTTMETDQSSGDLDAPDLGTSDNTRSKTGGRHLKTSPKDAATPQAPDGAGRQADWVAGAMAGGGGGGGGNGGLPMPNATSWTGYSGGGASAWVRPSGDLPARGPRGGKGGHRSSQSRS